MSTFWAVLALVCLSAGILCLAVIRFREIRSSPVLRKVSLILLPVFFLSVAGVIGTRFPHVSPGWEAFSAISIFGAIAIPLFFLFGSRMELAREIRTDAVTRRLFGVSLSCLAAAFLLWFFLAKCGYPIFPKIN